MSGLVHYFEGDCRAFELYAQDALADGISRECFNTGAVIRPVFATADLGRTKWVESYANQFGTTMAFARKTRNDEETEVHEIIGDVIGKDVIIYDDMTRSSGSLVKAAEAYKKSLARSVSAVLSHLALNNEGVISKLRKWPFRKVITTNTHPMSHSEFARGWEELAVVDVSPVFTEKIKQIVGME